MAEKYFDGNIPEANTGKFQDAAKAKLIIDSIYDLDNKLEVSLSSLSFSSGLESIWQLVNMANKYVEETKPWNLAKENKIEELMSFIYLLVRVIRKTADCIYPFMPQTSLSIKEQLGTKKVKKGKPLFPGIEVS
jgi:methionyl-tRNA synthetase